MTNDITNLANGGHFGLPVNGLVAGFVLYREPPQQLIDLLKKKGIVYYYFFCQNDARFVLFQREKLRGKKKIGDFCIDNSLRLTQFEIRNGELCIDTAGDG